MRKLYLLMPFIFCCVTTFAVGLKNNPSHQESDIFQSAFFLKNTPELVTDYNGRQIEYFANHGDISVYFTKSGPIYALVKADQKALEKLQREKEHEEKEHKGKKDKKETEEEEKTVIPVNKAYISVNWIGANPNPLIEPVEQNTGKYSFLQGTPYKDLHSVLTDGFKKIVYHDLYPGIDVEYSFPDQGGMKYNFIIHPGADPSQIKMEYEGKVKNIKVDPDGNMTVHTYGGDILEHTPVSYTSAGTPLASSYQVNGNQVTFSLPQNYDHNATITIDPWVSVLTQLTVTELGADVDYDVPGNLYVYGAGAKNTFDVNAADYQKLAKYSATGSFLWVFLGSIAVPAWNTTDGLTGANGLDPLSNAKVDRINQKTYVGCAFNATGNGTQVIRLNSGGTYDNFISTQDPDFLEVWSFTQNCVTGDIVAQGGGLTSNLNFTVINPGTGTVTTTNCTGIASTGTGFYGSGQDIVSGAVDIGQNLYVIMASDETGTVDNALYRVNSTYTGKVWGPITTAFGAFTEVYNMPDFYSSNNINKQENSNNFNALAANGDYLYYYDGQDLAAYNLATGATVGTPAFIVGGNQLVQGGIAVDNCNNIYLGGIGKILTYKFNGTTFTAGTAISLGAGYTTDTILDVRYNAINNQIYVAGTRMTGTYTATPSLTCIIAVPFTDTVTTTCTSATVTVYPDYAVLTNPTFTYVWQDSVGNILQTIGPETDTINTFTVPYFGTFTVQVQLTQNCGASSLLNTVSVNSCDTLVHSPDTTICAGQPVILSATGTPAGGTYLWEPGGSTSSTITVSPTATTNYIIKYTPTSGPAIIDTIVVTVNALPTPTVNSPTICAGQSATLTATGGGTYLWSTTQTTNPITVTPASTTTYKVTVTNAAGCSATASGTVTVNPVPTPTVNSPTICAGQSATLTATGGTTYVWSTTQTINPITVTPATTSTYSVTATTNGCSATASGTVTVNPLPTPTVNSPTICAGQSATLTATGGTNYVWSTTQTINPITVTPATTSTYSVTATTNGCSATASGTVTVNPVPTPTVNSPTICAGQSATLTATGGTTYVWSTTQTINPITVTPATTSTYSVTATTNGCSATASGTVTVNPIPTPTVNSPTICAGQSATLTATGGTTYVWSTTQTINPITVTPATTSTYSVTATTNGCSATASGTVTVNPIPTPTVNSPTICAGQSATLTATGGTTYVWSTTQTINPITVTPATTSTYSVTATTNGCSATASGTVTVNPVPTPTVNSPTICAGQSATLTATGGTTYVWSTTQTINPITVTPATTSTYSVTATTNGCSATALGTVTVNPLPTPTVNSPTICAGQSATLTATGGTTYVWSTTQTINPITVTPATTSTYSVTATTNGCSATASGTVTVNPVPIPTVNSPTICAGQSATLTATGGTAYVWSTTQTINPITVTPATTSTYSVTATTNGCSATASGTVTVNPVPTPTVNSPTICAGQSATLTATGGTTYVWSTTQTINPITVTPAATTTYSVTATTNGCSATASGTVTVNPIPTPTVNSPTICAGQSATLTATGGTTYVWSTTQTINPITVTPAATTTYSVTATTNGCSATASGTVTVNPIPTPTVNSPTICAGQSATLTATGGTTYVWSTTQTINPITVTPAATTTYTVTATTSGCTATASGTVTVNPVPTPTVNSPTICAGQSATLTATGGTTYVWSTTQTINPITVTPVTTSTYSVTATTNGCSATASGTVTVNPLPTPTVNSPTICAGQSATLTATGGTTYVWSTTQTINPITVTPVTTSTYSVTATTNGCSATASGTVTVNPLPVAGVNNASICAGGTATLTATGGTTYLWSTTQTVNPITVSPASNTTYDVTVTTAAGCSATTSSTVTVVTPPTVSSSSTTICLNSTGTLTATPSVTGGTYAWAPGTGSTQSINVSPTTNTTYTVTYAIPGCPAATNTGTVTVNPLPTPTVNSPTICAGTSATLTATGGVSYDWSTNQTINPITVTPASTTTYTVTATDANSCSATASGTVTVTPLPVVSLANATICAGNSATLTPVVSPAGGTYLWSDNETTNTILVTPATTTGFTVTYTASGCSSSAVNTVTVNQLPAPTVNNPTICTGVSDTLIATGGVSYVWNTTATTDSIIVSPTSTTTYTVTATDINGCSATASGTVTVNPLPTPSVNSPSICGGNAATLTATGGVSYVWNTQQTINPITTTTAGTYTVTATDANGCSATASGVVTVNPLPTPTVNNVTICSGGTANLIATGGVSYVWSTTATTNPLVVTPTTTTTYDVTVTDGNGCSATTSGTVTVNPLPVVTVSTDPALCTSTNGMAIANVSAGTPAYSYSWSAPGGTRDTLPNIAAGTYQVTVSDINGCTATASGQVSQQVSTIAVTEVSQHNLRCNNDGSGDIYISLSDNAGNVGSYTYTYNWTVASTQNLTGVQAGTYTVTVTDQFGCTGTGTWTITQPPLLTASATGTNPICFGQSNGSATVTPTGGTPNYSYSWNTSPVQTTATANNIPSGSYTVTVTDDSLCTATASVTLTDPAQITFGPSTIVNPSCFGLTNGSAQVSPQNGIGTYTYSWSTTPAQTSNPATDLAGGSYTVTATDANGCTASTTVNLVTPSQVQVTATGTNLSCYESGNGTATASASGGTPPYSYIWSNQDNTASISGLAAAAYSVTATDANGCTASASDTLSQPDAVSETLTSVRTNCPNSADGSITAVAGGGTPSFTYSLENANGTTVLQSGNTTGDFTGIGYGLYTVMATDANGCKISDTITVPEAPFNYYTDTTTGTTCYGSQYTNGSIELQGYSIPNGPFQYSINGGPFQVSPYFFDLAAGSYQVTAQDHYGCDTTFTVVVPSPLPATVQILPGDSTITAGSTLQLTTVFGPYSTDSITGYAWSPGTGMSCIDCPSPEVSPYANQTIYTVIITYNQGCTASATVQINTNGEPPMYIPNAFTPNGDGVNDVWYVFGTGIKDIKIMVFDRWGEKVFESDDQSVGWDGTYRGQLQPPDVFVYEVEAVYLDGSTLSRSGSITLIR